MKIVSLISKDTYRRNQNSVTMFLNYCIENNYDLNQIFIDSDIDEEGIIKKGNIISLLNDISFKNAKLLVNNSKEIAADLPSLIEIFIEFNQRGVQIEIIDSSSQDILSDSLLRLGYIKPKTETQIKISQSVKLKSRKGSLLGRAPFGYKKSLTGGFEIDNKKSDIIKNIFKLYSGNYGRDEKLGLRKISNIIKFVCQDDSLKWSPQTLRKILTNRFYTGVYRRDSVIISNNHEFIISEDKFAYVQDIFKKREIGNTRDNVLKNKNHIHNKTLYKCGYCKTNLNKSVHHRAWKKADGTVNKYIYSYINCENIKCKKLNKKRIRIEKKYFTNGHNVNSFIHNSPSLSYSKLVSEFKNQIKLVIRGKRKISDLKNDLVLLKKFENKLDINKKRNITSRTIEIKNNREKILTAL